MIPSATEAQTSASSEEAAIQPESVVSGYPVAPTYTLLRYDEDYSYLANPANRTEPLDVIKYMPLFNLGPSYFVTLGGDIREQYEFIQNDNFGLGSVNNHGYWLQRLMPYSDWHFGPFFRAFVQFKSSEEEGRNPDRARSTENGLTSVKPLSISAILEQSCRLIRRMLR